MTNFTQSIYMLLWLMIFSCIMLILMIQLHPITMLITMIFLNIISCILMSMWKSSYIMSFLIFLIMISGLLIMFMYFSSLISNDQLKPNLTQISKSMFFLTFLTILMSMNMNSYPSIMNLSFFFFNEINPMNSIFTKKLINMMYMYIHPLNNLSMITIMFILLTFISIIKINSSSHSYSMRKIKNYE